MLAGSFPGHSMGMAPMHGMGMAHAHGMGVASSSASGLLPQDTERPPIGCDPDAIKLFVGNLPKSCTEQQLLQLFESVGKVVELVIVRDKSTQQPKGSAFVWYATRAFAERAILQFNLRHCLPGARAAWLQGERRVRGRRKHCSSAPSCLQPGQAPPCLFPHLSPRRATL